jgi:8-oxo-dGTP diphosphatase
MDEKPNVGTALIITRDDTLLLMKHKGPHGAGTWSPPGGHLDFGETLEGCAAREAKEEVGLEGKPIGEPRIVSKQEVAEIGWFAWDALPEPLFLPLENLVRANSYPPK